MNGLALRINRTGAKKQKNSIGYAPVTIHTSFLDNIGNKAILQSFTQLGTADEQLLFIKKLLDPPNRDLIEILVIIFWEAEAKHPVKCFIARYVTKTPQLHQSFTDTLSKHVAQHLDTISEEYKSFIPIVFKVALCIENFPPGVAAIKVVDIQLAEYLRDSLNCCVKTLRESTLSPTEKNELFNLAHLSLRLFLHIVQKSSPKTVTELIPMFTEIRLIIQDLLFDNDSPMDTKSVSGILYLLMHINEFGPERWLDVLNQNNGNESLHRILANEAAQLALYSAIATVVSIETLQSQNVNNVPSVVLLAKRLLDIGERSSSESTFILGVTRTLTQISKHLDKITITSVGSVLVDYLLSFIWLHLEHYMDSVRHLTAQMLGFVVKYCAKLKKEGDDTAITKLFASLSSLDRARKSYYLSVGCVASELGAQYVLHMSRDVISHLLSGLGSQPVQASATTALEILLDKHAVESESSVVFNSWIKPLMHYVASGSLDSHALHIVESLLTRAVRLHEGLLEYIIPFLKHSTSEEPTDLKCILMLLSVVRKSGIKLPVQDSDDWKGLIGYDVLKKAAINAVDETRILSLSLIVESPKTTEAFASGELELVLWYLTYNVNAQSPSCRQLTLSLMKKFVKRLEDSYKVLKRQCRPNEPNHKVDYYLRFVDDLRHFCFESLIQGANYSRRCTALQLLVWCEQLNLDGYNRTWKPEYVEKLLLHLEDSYENNKAYALQILEACPKELLKGNTYSIILALRDIFRQASSLKPTDCVSAAYKLELIKKKLPEFIIEEKQCDISDPVTFALMEKLLTKLKEELEICKQSVVSAARQAPMYGLLHCMVHFIGLLDPGVISNDGKWSDLIAEVIETSVAVNEAVACVVNNSSPEGHLPMDMSGVSVTDDGNSEGLRLDDGRIVTAQMVLLCAWRSVKEVSLLLGSISSKLAIVGESEGGNVTAEQMSAIGQHFTTLLAQTKHRGAFEQAYVGFTCLLSRLWRCRSQSLHELPRSWLLELMSAISGPRRDLCATRRSAGLPFMIQALVTTELQVQGNPKGFHSCMSSLLSLARSSSASDEWSRTHALNILRALFRHSALEDSVAGYVGDGIMVAIDGFEGATWAERNSSTLLFSALMTRVFGVVRTRTERLCVRNTMTGRIFFLRYPQLYDYMLSKMVEVSTAEATGALRPSLYPVLLLLARLYPSSLEGTVSNLKLVAFVPHVLSCARSGVLKTRQLAAKAMVPLISPDQYMQHLRSMFQLLNDKNIKRNYCHGILLQLIRLLDAKPEEIVLEDATGFSERLKSTLWLLEQGLGHNPCYLIVDEYIKVLNLIAWRLPSLLDTEITNTIINLLDTFIFNTKPFKITSGREIALANSTYLYFILITKNREEKEINNLIHKTLQHSCYEVLLSVLNYILIMNNSLETENNFQEHIKSIANRKILNEVNTELISKVLDNKYLECKQKSLIVLTLQDKDRKYDLDTEKLNEIARQKLNDFSSNTHENMTHVYLERLLDFVTSLLENKSGFSLVMLDVIRLVFECSSSENSDDTRGVAVAFLERNAGKLLEMDLSDLDVEEKFEFKATTWSTIITLLEDDEAVYRQRISDCISKRTGNSQVVPSATGSVVRELVSEESEGGALICVLALLDFRSVVCISDEVGDEARVFDQNERYNIYLEETVWTNACAELINAKYDKSLDYVVDVINDARYRNTFEKLCGDNVKVFEAMVKGSCEVRKDLLNPKIALFVERLRK